MALFLSLALTLATSLTADARASTSFQAPSAAVVYSGETLFRGLAFAEGPVAARFEATAGVPPASAEASATIDRVIDGMSMLEPEFFGSFAARIQSGDRIQIREAIEDAATLAGRAAKEELGSGDARNRSVGDSTGDCIFIAGAIVFIVAGVVTVVIDVTALTVVNLVVTGNVAVNVDQFFSRMDGGHATPLNSDLWIDQIARTLKV